MDKTTDTEFMDVEDKIASIIGGAAVEGDDAPDNKEIKEQQEAGNEILDKEDKADEADKEEVEKELKAKDEEEFLELDPADLAAIFGIDANQIHVNDEGQVFVKTKVGEEISNVQLNELIKSYQLDKVVNKKSQALSDEKRNFEAEREALRSQYTEAIQGAVGLVGAMEQQLLANFQSVDWNNLRQSNPAEFAAKKAEFTEAQGAIQQIKATVANQARNYHEQLTQQKMADLHKILEKEQARLSEAIPEFGDEATADEYKTKLWSYLTSTYKFSEQDLSQVFDHRLVVMANKAMLYDKLQQKGSDTVEKIRKLPKVLKPGSHAKRSNVEVEAKKQKLIKLKKSGRDEDLQAILLDRLGG